MTAINIKKISGYSTQKSNSTESLIDSQNIADNSTDRKSKILMIGMHLTKTRGGITTLIADILESPLKSDFDFEYIESQADDFGQIQKLILAIQSWFRCIWICLSERPKLVYVHLGSNASLYRESVFIYLAKIFKKKVVTHFHAGDIDNYFPKQNRFGRWFIKRAIEKSDSIIAVSHESKKQLERIANCLSVVVIENAINTESFCKIPMIRENRNTTNLLFVGATGKLKGERDLIEALSILSRDKKPNLRISFLGYGAENLMQECENRGITDLIDFLGIASLDDRIKYFANADIFILPTYAEAMPISIIEAMAAGLPVISTTVGGIPELIDDGIDGLLFTPGDTNALAKKIALLVNDRESRNRIGKAARQKSIEQIGFNRYVEKLRLHLSENI